MVLGHKNGMLSEYCLVKIYMTNLFTNILYRILQVKMKIWEKKKRKKEKEKIEKKIKVERAKTEKKKRQKKQRIRKGRR